MDEQSKFIKDEWFGKFCTKCGTKKILHTKELKDFVPKTGKHYKEYELVCPNKKHFWDGHDSDGWTEPGYWGEYK